MQSCIGCVNPSAMNIAAQQTTLGDLRQWFDRNQAKFCKMCAKQFWTSLKSASQDPAILARDVKYDPKTGTFLLHGSQPKPGERERTYRITVVDHESVACTCPNYEFVGTNCKHMQAVKLHMRRTSRPATERVKL